jgi:hypothetical protein
VLGTRPLTVWRIGPDSVCEQLVHQHIDAAQEKAGDRGDVPHRLALGQAPF